MHMAYHGECRILYSYPCAVGKEEGLMGGWAVNRMLGLCDEERGQVGGYKWNVMGSLYSQRMSRW